MVEGTHAAVLEALTGLLEHYNAIAVSVVAIVLATVVISNVRVRKWGGVPYTVPIPEQCKPGWEGEVLENPAITVWGNVRLNLLSPADCLEDSWQ